MRNELLEKGREAISKGEWEQSKEILEEALRKEQSPEVYEELAWANWWLNDAPAVFETRSKAYNLFLEKNDKFGAARNACWSGLDYIEFKGEFAIASGWFKRAENLLAGTSEKWEHIFIKILKARWAFQVEKNPNLAYKLIDESLALSRKIKNVEGEMLAEALKGFILVLEGKISEGMPLLDDATLLALTSEHGDIKITTITCCYLIDACERIRDFERAAQWCKHVKEICKKWRYKAMFANCKMKYAGILIWEGKWEEAEEELLSASTELKEFRPIQVEACTVRLADLKRRQGKWKEAENILINVGRHPLKALFLASLYFDKSDYEKALDNAEKYFRHFTPKEKAERTTVIELLTRINIKLGKMKEAENLINELKEIAEAINTLPIQAAVFSAEGFYLLAQKNYTKAKQNFEDAVDIYEKIKLPFETARNRMSLAETLIQLESFAQAEIELNAAMQISKNLGSESDFEKAKNLLKNLYKNKADEKRDNTYEFTGRELEVLRLLAEGKNNEDIAEKLFLSVRTVEKHITNIYGKMGISGKSARAYAASFAIKNHLILS